MLKAKGHLNHYRVTVLFDCGSTEDVVFERVVHKAKLDNVALDMTILGFSLGMTQDSPDNGSTDIAQPVSFSM